MPTALPIRDTSVERVHATTVIAVVLAFTVLLVMSVLTPTKYPAYSGVPGTNSSHRI